MRRLSPALLTLASATLYAAAWHGPAGWVAGWFWPLPVLVAAFKARPLPAAAWGFSAWLLGSLAWWPMERAAIAPAFFLPAHAAMALPFAFSILVLRRWFSRSGPGSPFAFAAAFTLISALQVALSHHGTWGLLIYSQTFLPILQCLAWGGPFLLLFAMMAFPASLALALVRRDRAGGMGAAGASLLVLAVMGGGWFRLQTGPRLPRIRVGLSADDRLVQSHGTTQASVALPILERQARQAARLAQRGAECIVLPEEMAGVTPAYEASADARLAGAAPGAILVAGLNGTGRTPRLNLARVYADGRPQATMLKHHLVPRWEAGYASGPGPLVWPWHGLRLGVAICKDFDFTDTSRALGRGRVQLAAAPAWDFYGTEAIHARMARFRAIEGGFALARCAQEGQLDLWDGCGRSLGSTATAGGEASLLADLPLGPGGTLYARWGDWVLVLAGLWLAFAWIAEQRRA